jgi:hypothetical protein
MKFIKHWDLGYNPQQTPTCPQFQLGIHLTHIPIIEIPNLLWQGLSERVCQILYRWNLLLQLHLFKTLFL